MDEPDSNPEKRIASFQLKEVRRVIHNNERWFVITDVVAALTDSANPKGYFTDMRRRDPQLADAVKGGQIATPLGLEFDTAGGRQMLQCWNTEGIFRLIQSIPIRDELTGEWQKRGVKEQREYAILTAEISKAAFGLTPTEYAEFKKLKRENLRDHMTDLELIFSMLGKAATTEIARNRDAQGFPQNQQAANSGGMVAGNARRELEKKSGRKVVTSENYLALAQKVKRANRLK